MSLYVGFFKNYYKVIKFNFDQIEKYYIFLDYFFFEFLILKPTGSLTMEYNFFSRVNLKMCFLIYFVKTIHLKF